MSTDTQDSREVVEIGAEAMLESDLGKMILARHEAKTLLTAALTAIEASGWKIVKVEFTKEMREASEEAVYWAKRETRTNAEIASASYQAALSASPKVTR